MDSRCLSAGTVRFLGHLVLLGRCSSLAVGLLACRSHLRPHGQTPGGFPRSALLRYDWCRCPLYSGVVVSDQGGRSPTLVYMSQDRNPCLDPLTPPKPSFRCVGVTKPQRVPMRHHASLPLARSGWMVHPPLRRYPALRTPPLPATHVGMGDRLGHEPDGGLSSAILKRCDLVSHYTCPESLRSIRVSPRRVHGISTMGMSPLYARLPQNPRSFHRTPVLCC